MSIRAARCYDLESRAIIFGNGQPCTVDNMKAAGQGRYSELLYEFCHNMASDKTDNAEYALLNAICIFSGWYILMVHYCEHSFIFRFHKCICSLQQCYGVFAVKVFIILSANYTSVAVNSLMLSAQNVMFLVSITPSANDISVACPLFNVNSPVFLLPVL